MLIRTATSQPHHQWFARYSVSQGIWKDIVRMPGRWDLLIAMTKRRNKMSDWKSDLACLFSEKEENNKSNEEKLKITRAGVAKFYSEVVIPAFEELKNELEKYHRDVKIYTGEVYASIIVGHKDETEANYSIRVRIIPGKAFPFPETIFIELSGGKSYRVECFLRTGSQDYDITQINKDEIIQDFLSNYKMHLRYL
jgi:hypothetical protein